MPLPTENSSTGENGQSAERTCPRTADRERGSGIRGCADRRSILKRIGIASAGVVGLGTGSTAASAGARSSDGQAAGATGTVPETNTTSDWGFGLRSIDWEVVDQDSNGDDIYEFDLSLAWGEAYNDGYDRSEHIRNPGPDTLTIYWDGNIFGFEQFVDGGPSYVDYADEFSEFDGNMMWDYDDQDPAFESGIFTDQQVIYEEVDGWVAEFDIPSRTYISDERIPRRRAFGPFYVVYNVSFQLLHQDNSGGRVFFEIARNVDGGSGSISLCGGLGPGSVCYDTGWGGGPRETFDSGNGYMIR